VHDESPRISWKRLKVVDLIKESDGFVGSTKEIYTYSEISCPSVSSQVLQELHDVCP